MNASKTNLPLALVAVAAALSLPGSAAADMPQKNVAPWVAAAPKVGDAPDGKQVHLSLFIGFKNLPQLQQLIESQSTPGNPQYGKYLTPEAFHARFAPDAAKVTLVQDTLHKLGFTVEYTPDSGLFVDVAGSIGQVKSAFGVSQSLYAYAGKTLRANAETPHLPAKIADIVTYVGGLDETRALLKPGRINLHDDDAQSVSARKANAAPSPDAAPPVPANADSPACSNYWGDHTAKLSTQPAPFAKTLPWLICGYTPQQIRQAYGADKVAQTGKGVRVAVVDTYASPTIVQDVNRYSKNHGLPQLTSANFQQMVPAGLFNVPESDPCDPQSWYGEETLDIEAVHAMAPDASILFGADTCSDPGNAALYKIIDKHSADIVSNSYGFDDDDESAELMRSENQYFMQAAAEGISVVFSSGDDGDLINNLTNNGTASGSWEAVSPYVTAVGGTSLALIDKDGKKNEWGWGTYRAYLTKAKVAAGAKTIATTGTDNDYIFYGGSGGGPSLTQLEPAYQKNVVPGIYSGFTVKKDGSKVTFANPRRVTPDISMEADPYTGFLIGETYTKAGDPNLDGPCLSLSKTTEYCEGGTGGTSLSTPLFAGVLALVDQARFSRKQSAIGLVNRLLYTLPVGVPGTTAAPIIDVRAPTTPTAILRGYLGDPTKIRVVTMNANVNAKKAITQGVDSSYKVVPGYDQVTGRGTPNIPALISAAVK